MLPGQVGPRQVGGALQRLQRVGIDPLDEGDGVVPGGVAQQVQLPGLPGDEHGGRRRRAGHRRRGRHRRRRPSGAPPPCGHLEAERDRRPRTTRDPASSRSPGAPGRFSGSAGTGRSTPRPWRPWPGCRPEPWSRKRSWWASNEHSTSAAASGRMAAGPGQAVQLGCEQGGDLERAGRTGSPSALAARIGWNGDLGAGTRPRRCRRRRTAGTAGRRGARPWSRAGLRRDRRRPGPGRRPGLHPRDGRPGEVVDVVEVAEQRPGGEPRPGGDLLGARSQVSVG